MCELALYLLVLLDPAPAKGCVCVSLFLCCSLGNQLASFSTWGIVVGVIIVVTCVVFAIW